MYQISDFHKWVSALSGSNSCASKPGKLQVPRMLLRCFLLAALLTAGLPANNNAREPEPRSEPDAPQVLALAPDDEPDPPASPSGSLTTGVEGSINSAVVEVDGKVVEYFVLQIEYSDVSSRRAKFTDSRVSRIKGATVLTVTDRYADVFVNSSAGCDLPQIKNDRSVVRCEFAKAVTAPPPPPSKAAKFYKKGIPERIVRNGYAMPDGTRLTGRGVYVAIPDTGIDFRHPDYIDYDESGNPISRLSFLWDSTLEFRPGRGMKAPFSYPNGTSIGTLFTQEQLTAELRAVRSGATPTIPPMDDDGHGTACAGIAAGNGNADKGETGLKRNEVIGVAPAASIIGIRIGKTGGRLTNAYLLNTIYEWLDQVAGEHPLVISSSFGSHYTGHDGQSVAERELNSRLAGGEKRGRAMVVAAGNDRGKSLHAKVTFGGLDQAQLVSWKAAKVAEISLFFSSSSARDIQIVPVGDTGIKEEPQSRQLNRITNQVQTTLSVLPGEGQIKLFNKSGKPTEVHLYFANGEAGSFKMGVEADYLVSSPATAESVIAVGSSDWNDSFNLGGKPATLPSVCKNEAAKSTLIQIGWLSCYSSPGPTRDSRIKPDIVAPGEWYAASYSANSGDRWTSDTTGMYVAMNGTSAATPYTAGVIALLFEKAPGLTTNRIKELFRQHCTKTDLKPFPGDVPNHNWGNGKLDFGSVERILAALDDSKTQAK